MFYFDLVVIGAGPAGQAAASQARRLGARTAVVEMASQVGGTCVFRGSIPSRTLRETALHNLLQPGANPLLPEQGELEIATLMARLGEVTTGHAESIAKRLSRSGVVSLHGRGRLVDAQTVEVTGLGGDKQLLKTRRVVLATGGRPRAPEHLPVDHEHVLDGDSILSMIYLPRSLMVVCSGALAFEYASIFAALGVAVSVLDPNDEPLPGMEYEQNQELLRGFERRGCLYSARAEVLSLHWDGLDVVAQLAGGREARARKALVAAGIEPVLKGVPCDALGIDTDEGGFIRVDDSYQTSLPGVYAAGDVARSGQAASAASLAGQRAARHALDAPPTAHSHWAPIATVIDAIPGIASVGLGEAEARATYGDIQVGTACYSDVARSRIVGLDRGRLKVIADPKAERLLGAHIVGNRPAR